MSQTFDTSIPVLTVVFDEQAGPAPDRDAAPAQLETGVVDSWAEPEWQLLERRLSERILGQLQGRVDLVLEQRLRDSMAEALKHALAGLGDEIHRSLQQTIEQSVLRAVAQEVAHLRTLKK